MISLKLWKLIFAFVSKKSPSQQKQTIIFSLSTDFSTGPSRRVCYLGSVAAVLPTPRCPDRCAGGPRWSVCIPPGTCTGPCHLAPGWTPPPWHLAPHLAAHMSPLSTQHTFVASYVHGALTYQSTVLTP